MISFVAIFVVVLLAAVAAVCGFLLLQTPGALELPHADAWPYSQRRFALRGHRALRE